MKKALLIITVFLGLATAVLAAEVVNVVEKQEGNRVLFEYDVSGEGNEETEVNVTFRINGVAYTPDKLHLEGDYGKMRVGKGKRLYWNVLQDFPRGLSITFNWEIVAGGKEFKDAVTGMEFVFVKGGCFQMGDTFGDGESDEKPVHDVCVGDFYMGKYEVTQGQWKGIMGDNPSSFKDCGDKCPVETVSWNDIQGFINKLNQKTGKTYRLPTEAEWEYAARSGGKREKYAGGNDVDSIAWHTNNSGNRAHPVGTKAPNGLGIYDMSGNVWEWCSDWYHEKYYEHSPKNNPKGPTDDWTGLTSRMLRGGSWAYNPGVVRTTNRYRNNPVGRNDNGGLGFRLLGTP